MQRQILVKVFKNGQRNTLTHFESYQVSTIKFFCENTEAVNYSHKKPLRSITVFIKISTVDVKQVP